MDAAQDYDVVTRIQRDIVALKLTLLVILITAIALALILSPDDQPKQAPPVSTVPVTEV